MTTLTPPPRCFALVPCAGAGLRAGSAMPKQYQMIAGRPMVMHTLDALASVSQLVAVVVVLAPTSDALPACPPGVVQMTCGGASRAKSVFNGLQALLEQGATALDWVLVHDAARCMVTPEQVEALITVCENDAVGGLLALPLPDTLKAAEGGRVSATLDRSDKWLAQTPQMFRIGPLLSALQARADEDFAGVTDEASAMEMAGHAPLLVPGSAQNFKVTYPEDFALAEAILRSRS